MNDTKKGIVIEDPMSDFEIGDGFLFKIIGSILSDALNTPDTVSNWDFFQGALMSLVLLKNGESHIKGTAFLVAPGVALTAKHIISDYIDDLSDGKISVCCIGVKQDCLAIWNIQSVSCSNDNDIAILSLIATSKIPNDRTFFQFGISTRTPKPGENIHIVGYREDSSIQENNSVRFFANVFAAQGVVENVFPKQRDNSFINFPAIELKCGAIGGMSGGVALDQNGLVIGIVSSSFETEDKCGPTYVSWIISVLNMKFTPVWPRGLYSQQTTLINIDKRLVYIDKRSAISEINDDNFIYSIWFE